MDVRNFCAARTERRGMVSLIAEVKDGVQKLEEKGIIIQDRSKRIEQIKLKELQQLEESKKEAQ